MSANILKKKEAILILEKYLDQPVELILSSGEVVAGTLKGFDSNVNVVLANALQRRGAATRWLGSAIIRGSVVAAVLGGANNIDNPF